MARTASSLQIWFKGRENIESRNSSDLDWLIYIQQATTFILPSWSTLTYLSDDHLSDDPMSCFEQPESANICKHVRVCLNIISDIRYIQITSRLPYISIPWYSLLFLLVYCCYLQIAMCTQPGPLVPQAISSHAQFFRKANQWRCYAKCPEDGGCSGLVTLASLLSFHVWLLKKWRLKSV